VRRVGAVPNQPARTPAPGRPRLPPDRRKAGLPGCDLRWVCDAAVMTPGVDAQGMMENIGEPSGIILLRAWVEGRSPEGLRVRVIRVRHSGTTSISSAGTVEATCEIVANWLNELLREGTTPRPPLR